MDALLNRRPPTTWERFWESPLLFLARLLYAKRSQATPLLTNAIRVVCISDTHNSHHLQPPLPAGDILIHSGDLTNSGTQAELDDALFWLDSQPHPHKFFIAGNHDTCLASLDPDIVERVSREHPGLVYLEETSVAVTIRGRVVTVYGSPYTPRHGSWVFQYPRVSPVSSPSPSRQSKNPRPNTTDEHEPEPDNQVEQTEAEKTWSRIPLLTDILITHGPPYSHLDLDRLVGCHALLEAVRRVRPRLHVFGHVHAARGVEHVAWDQQNVAYERVCEGRAGWVGLMRLAWWTVGKMWFGAGKLEGEGAMTTMVNASSVGGLRDDKRKGAIVVEI